MKKLFITALVFLGTQNAIANIKLVITSDTLANPNEITVDDVNKNYILYEKDNTKMEGTVTPEENGVNLHINISKENTVTSKTISAEFGKIEPIMIDQTTVNILATQE